jgi:uncharacterized protein
MKCIVSGGTGFIGRRVVERLRGNGHEVAVWSRRGSNPSLDGMDAVIHLAGEPVAQRWNATVKQRILDSRVLGTRRLVDEMGRVGAGPKVLVSASAIGYYGERGDEILTENSGPGEGFLADVCRGWEAEAGRAAQFDVRVMRLRIGFVLGKKGGALGKMVPAFKAGVGGKLGSGKQWMPWVHIDDVVEMFARAVESDMSGVWNATAPNPVRNEEFTKELGRVLHRPAFFPVPGFALKIAFGEMGEHMLDSARVIPEAALTAGYRFRFSELGAALRDLLG